MHPLILITVCDAQKSGFSTNIRPSCSLYYFVHATSQVAANMYY